MQGKSKLDFRSAPSWIHVCRPLKESLGGHCLPVLKGTRITIQIISPVCTWNGEPPRDTRSFQKPSFPRRRVSRRGIIVSMDEKASYRMSSSGNRSQTFRTAYFSLVFFPIFLVLPTQFEFPPFFFDHANACISYRWSEIYRTYRPVPGILGQGREAVNCFSIPWKVR